MKLLLALFVALCLAHFGFAQSISNSTSNCTVCPGIKNHWQASLLPSDLYVQVNESTFGSLIMNLEYANSTGNFSNNLVLNYHLFMKGSNLTSARLHVGLRCSAGPVVALLTNNGTGNLTVSLPNGGLFAEGSLSSWNLTGPLENFTIYDLIQEFSEGNVYINVTSAEFPSGLVRGQVQSLQEDTPVIPEDLLVAVNCTGKFQKLVDYIAANSSNCTAGNNTHHWNVTAELLNNRTCSNWTMDCRCQVYRTIARNCTYNCSRISEGSNCTAYCVRTSNSTFTTCPRNFTTGCNSTSRFLQRPVCECNARNCTTNGTCPGVRDSALAKDGSFTVFAMTDAALGWDEMTSFEPHVVEGIYHVSDFVGKITTLETLSGAKLIIDGIQPAGIRYLKAPRQHRVTVNGVPISHPRAAVAKNGILHGLGGVVHHQN